MTYGVIPTGFSRKPLAVILAELQEAMVEHFGAEVIQTPQSPLGQLNGMFADATNLQWETAEDAYQSFDIDQADGPRLDMAAKLRRLKRNVGETDATFRLRISNESIADIKLITNIGRLRAIDGVTWAHAHENATSIVNDLGMPPHSVAYAVIGGDDGDVAWSVYQLSVPGIELFGNYMASIEADGYCQNAIFIRPTDVPIKVEVDVRHIPDSFGCQPPNIGTLQAAFIAEFAGYNGYRNGDTVRSDQMESAMARQGNLKVVDVRIARHADLIITENIETTIFERPVIISPYVEVRYVA